MFTEENTENVAAQLNAPDGDPGTMANAAQPPNRFVAYFRWKLPWKIRFPPTAEGWAFLQEIRFARQPTSASQWLRFPSSTEKDIFASTSQKRARQTEEAVEWEVEKHLQEEEPHVSVTLEGRKVELRAWRYTVKGVRGYEVPVYLLDADLPPTTSATRTDRSTLRR